MAHDRFDHCTRQSARRRSKRGQHLQALGRCKGGFGTKVHALCDALGNPLRFFLTPNQANDFPQALPLLEGYRTNIVLADRGYDGDALINVCSHAVIPPRRHRVVQRSYDTALYKERNLIERVFNQLKHFRRVAIRYDKLAVGFFSFVHLAAIYLLLK